MKYSVLDLFAGCGGLGHGFKINGNFEINLANDIWEPAKNTYTYNNPNVPFILDDISNLKEDILQKYFPNGVSVIIGGPPCQGFSMCGARDINDERNDLFYEYARIISFTKPYIFIMENVKGLLSMKNKKGKLAIDAIRDEFESYGYNIEQKVLNAKYYKVPQSRERVILVGTRKDLPDNYEYPVPQLNDNNTFTMEDALCGLSNHDSQNGQIKIDNKYYNEYYETIKGDGKIYNHVMPSHKKDVENRMSFVPQGGNWKNIPQEYRVGGIHSNAYRRLHLNQPSVTIKHAYKSMIIHPIYNRCLSIREVARIQSFSDDYIFQDSKTSQYQQLANAVPPNLSKSLANSVSDYLSKNNLKPVNTVGNILDIDMYEKEKNTQLTFIENAI